MSVMSWLVVIALCVGVVSAVPSPTLAPLNPLEHTEHTIPEEYIVVFKQDACKTQVQEHMKSLNDTLEAFDGVYYVRYTYDMGSFRGYSARMDEMTLGRVRHMSEVDYVERNQRIHSHDNEHEEQMTLERVHHTSMSNVDVERNQRAHSQGCKEQMDVGWGLVRISHKGVHNSKNNYVYNEAKQGEGVNIYLLDSGIDLANPHLVRAKWGKMFVPGAPKKDYSGHGTAMAAVAVSRKYGVAKMATVIALGISDEKGNMNADAALAALDHIGNVHTPKKSVALIGFWMLDLHAKAKAIDEATNKLFMAGVPVVVAAGNDKKDACTMHPAAATEAITVAASNYVDRLSTVSNYGKCVNIIAPGEDIRTTAELEDDIRKTGTAYSASFVAGVLASIMTNGDLTATQARDKLYELAEKGVIAIPEYAAGSENPKNLDWNRMLNHVCK